MLANAAQVNPVDLAYLLALSEEEREYQAGVLKARAYHAGAQQAFLTDRMRQFLQLDSAEQTFRLNFARQVALAVTERLTVAGWDCADDDLRAWAAQVWAANRMDARQGNAHLYAVRDGEAFVAVEWDAARGVPKLTVQPRYTGVDVSYTGRYRGDSDTSGDGYGCQMVYPFGDVNEAPLYAVRRFTDYDPASKTPRLRSRATLFYPERIEKYAYTDGAWRPVQDAGDTAWPIPWVDASGAPLGIAVAHFVNAESSPEAYDAWPVQDLADKTTLDLIASADVTAFRLYVALGWLPTSDGKAPAADGSNALKLQPGTLIGTTKDGADFKAIDGADLSAMIDLANKNVIDMAQITNTPVSRFVFTKQLASADTLKGQEMPFVFKVRNRQTAFGYPWAQAMDLARKLQNLYGAPVNADEPLTPRWAPVTTPSVDELAKDVQLKLAAGVPREQIWAELGYTTDQIEAFAAMPSMREQAALLAAGVGGANG